MRQVDPPPRQDGTVWWASPEDADEEEEEDEDEDGEES
jgi:hypothetical protein